MTTDEILKELEKLHDSIESIREMLAAESSGEPEQKTAQRRQPESGMEYMDIKEIARLTHRNTRETVRRLIAASHDTASGSSECIQSKQNIPRLNTSARTRMKDGCYLLQIEVRIPR